MRSLSLSILLLLTSFHFAVADGKKSDLFPERPNERITPGDICDIATSFRYPERIAYCERDVTKQEKAEIFTTYDVELGFHTRELNRADFKIDHYIPLCMGGSNKEDNLWPQYKQIYQLTDPIEPLLCQLMAGGKLLQVKAIEIIRHVKRNPVEAPKYIRDLENQLRN